MTFVVTQGCVDILDKSCVGVCPVDCIYEGDRMMYINADECVDCGACEPVCPQEAIFYDEEVPEALSVFVDGSREFFSDLGSPGGAAEVGRVGKDSPALVAVLSSIPRAEAARD
ncbi:ferredoxin [Amycolatopsis alkalitolerans]|uniref:Ferredoxin n=1 Tax=Amycolatopsis alkalitolerans TaxID=2547244 RepID=A0A5C4LS27_9PSEU|nr:ferredoxin [Amycolatopsis alkalitolerans]TNC18723.1 ferredoxin [Amycolatopsis alkalitolerans]